MPVIKSNYTAPLIFRNYHFSTIYASLLRKVTPQVQQRNRMELPDGDFLDLDWSYAGRECSSKVLIILHGLEGNAQRPYVMGMAKHFTRNGWDTAAINFRGCSGEINRLYRSYNAGASEDLLEVIDWITQKQQYNQIAITGFSLGGNLMLKYLGEGNILPPQLRAAVAISAPCDLYQSMKKLEEPSNILYSRRFVKKLKKQLMQREELFPGHIEKKQISACKSLYDIDNLYTGKAHGFKDARDYYQRSSALEFIPNIRIPTLLINAKNDAFLSPGSSPVHSAENNPNFYLEVPAHGGHVGFLQHKNTTYAEERTLAFINEHV